MQKFIKCNPWPCSLRVTTKYSQRLLIWSIIYLRNFKKQVSRFFYSSLFLDNIKAFIKIKLNNLNKFTGQGKRHKKIKDNLM